MAKLALIIGSQTFGLYGVNRDATAVDALLTPLGFETTVCVDEKARRQEILDAYEELIDHSQEGDAAVVFYSGHGALAVNPSYEEMRDAGQAPLRYYQFIVPFDMKETTADDFRGITNIELSLLLARLTEKTKNVTVVLDCCHSARMSRDVGMTPKALPKPWLLGVQKHLTQLVSENDDLDLLDVESNPYAVRLVASSVSQSAFEYTNKFGERRGLLAESFQLAMEEAEGLDVSWHSLGTRIREWVLKRQPSQRPEVEGPADRLLFELETVDLTGVLPVIFHEDEPILQGGRLMGVNIGDKYAIASQGVEKATSENTIAEATVSEVTGAISKIDLDYLPGHATMPAGASAFPVSSELPAQAVLVRADGEVGEQLRTRINASQRLFVAEDEEAQGLLAQVIFADEQIDLRDRSGSYSLIEQKPLDQNGIVQTVHNLNEFARAQVFLNLSGGVGESALDSPFDVEFGRVIDGKENPIQEAGDLLAVGDRAYIKITNNSENNLYCSIFDIGLAGKISLMTGAEPSGVEVLPKKDYILGYREGSGLKGLPLTWPKGVPEDGPRDESLMVIVSDKPQDIRPLQGRGMRGLGTQLSSLQNIVDQIGLVATRDFGSEEGAPNVRYAVERIDFQLSPVPASDREKGDFLIDERPSLSILSVMPKSIADPPSKIAIRLKELIVHSNRALISSEIRLDNMIVTGLSPENEGGFYKGETARFPNIKDGDHLPLNNMLVYYGPVAHFVDMAVWVSRDQKDSLTLADMIKAELNSPDFKTVAAAIAALAIAAPQAVLMIGAVGGAATLIQIGTKLLMQASGKSIGLYRTSHLAYEQFGVGSHPIQGVMRAQDFSFSYEVIPID